MRLAWIDVIRSLAIFFVVFIHSSSAVLPPAPKPLSVSLFPLLIHLIARTGVPLFIMVSGALLLAGDEPLPQYFQKRISRVLVPWFLWTLIYMGYFFFTGRIQPQNLSGWKYFFEMVFLSKFWFLPVIFTLYLFIPLIRPAVKKYSDFHYLYFFLIWFAFVSVLPLIHPSPTFPSLSQPGIIYSALGYSGFLISGFYLSQIGITRKTLIYSLYGLLAGIFLSFTPLLFSNTWQILEYFNPGIIISSLSMFVLIKSLFTLSWPDLKSDFIQEMGRSSFGIFLIHELVYSVYRFPVILKNPLLHSFLYTVNVFVISLIFIMILRRSRFGRLFVP